MGFTDYPPIARRNIIDKCLYHPLLQLNEAHREFGGHAHKHTGAHMAQAKIAYKAAQRIRHPSFQRKEASLTLCLDAQRREFLELPWRTQNSEKLDMANIVRQQGLDTHRTIKGYRARHKRHSLSDHDTNLPIQQQDINETRQGMNKCAEWTFNSTYRLRVEPAQEASSLPRQIVRQLLQSARFASQLSCIMCVKRSNHDCFLPSRHVKHDHPRHHPCAMCKTQTGHNLQ